MCFTLVHLRRREPRSALSVFGSSVSPADSAIRSATWVMVSRVGVEVLTELRAAQPLQAEVELRYREALALRRHTFPSHRVDDAAFAQPTQYRLAFGQQ